MSTVGPDGPFLAQHGGGLAAFDRAQRGAGQAAAVGDHRGTGVQQADQGVDVPGFPRPPEVPDEAGLPGRGGRGSLRGADAAAGCGGQLAACRRVRPVIWATSAKEQPKTSCRMSATRPAGVSESSTTSNARLTDSSRMTRPAGWP